LCRTGSWGWFMPAEGGKWYHVSERPADPDLGQEVPAVSEESRCGDRALDVGHVPRVVAGDGSAVFGLCVDGDAEASREGEPAAVDRLRAEDEAKLRHRGTHVVVGFVAVEVKLGGA